MNRCGGKFRVMLLFQDFLLGILLSNSMKQCFLILRSGWGMGGNNFSKVILILKPLLVQHPVSISLAAEPALRRKLL